VAGTGRIPQGAVKARKAYVLKLLREDELIGTTEVNERLVRKYPLWGRMKRQDLFRLYRQARGPQRATPSEHLNSLIVDVRRVMEKMGAGRLIITRDTLEVKAK
jgi:hypothetical protein